MKLLGGYPMSVSSSPARLAAFLASATLLAAIALPVSAAVIWLFWHRLAGIALTDLRMSYDVTGLSAGARFIGFVLYFVGAALQAFGLLGVRQTFLEAAQGRAYSARAIDGFTRFAWVAVAMVLVGIAQETGLILILSISDPNKMGALSIQFGSKDVQALFMGLLLVFVARVFNEGKRAKDENAMFL